MELSHNLFKRPIIISAPAASFLLISLLTFLSISAVCATDLDDSLPYYTYKLSSVLIRELRAAGFELMATALQISPYNRTINTTSSTMTLFAPTDSALCSVTPLQGFINLLTYHIVRTKLSYNDLVELPVGATIATLLPDHSLAVTSTIVGDSPMLLINEAEVIVPEIYDDQFVSVHGVNGVLQPKVFGFNIPFMEMPPEMDPSSMFPFFNVGVDALENIPTRSEVSAPATSGAHEDIVKMLPPYALVDLHAARPPSDVLAGADLAPAFGMPSPIINNSDHDVDDPMDFLDVDNPLA